ncbi:hypothetical protein ABDK96_10000 [Citricoccus nitrophenolicus]|uniref:Restriction endonuclease n=1 Tax=Citricoccus nitrophenolicus TaxID=863575 RepID=A0ABV0IIL1_9MICC
MNVVPFAGNRWKVTASSYVGSLVADGVTLLIRPKINPENLFLLLEPGLPPKAWRDEVFEYDTSADLLSSVISLFARVVETTLGRGVLKSYEEREEPLVAIRGRINLTEQFRRAGVLTPVACAYDNYSENVIENRALRAAIRLALRVPLLAPKDRRRLMSQLVALDEVDDVHVQPETIDSIHVTRLNEHYAPALGLARLLLANLTLTDRYGSASASSFMVDMNDLFQRFVTDRLRRSLRGQLDVISEPDVHLGAGRQVSMHPDLVFRDLRGADCFVGDVKYKLTRDARAHSSDYYQLLAYTTAMNLSEGILIYCRAPDGADERTIRVKHTDKQLLLRAIDLAGTPEQVEREIAELAKLISAASRRLDQQLR